ncbi:YceI family protein [Puniceicoccus vermicola]|uniref:YceI family protein n=1 Tax=Puniceicoccus vermicola TaxID=388746 RepID=A0A7X1E7M9_9BACT|nr:YceI family protein [Puniceicoccus vermicola]MBC2603907.1 YceI family protein [Puniceicoccus vermicola]
MKKSFILATASLVALASLASAAPKTFKADPAHSSINFKIRHFFTPIPGNFGEFEATIVYDEADPSKSSATASIEVESIDTDNDKRDDHLQSDDFFNEEANPEITFKSTSWEKTGDNEFDVKGDLTMAGQTKEVDLVAKMLGAKKNQKGVLVSGWEITGTIDRRDWGINYGQGIVGNEVDIDIFIEAPEA